MRLACYSDTHGKVPSPLGEGLPILHAGDVYHKASKVKVEGISLFRPDNFYKASGNDVDGLRKWARSGGLHAVRGNHDCVDPCGVFAAGDASGRVVELAPHLFLVGLGWHGERYYELPREADLRGQCADVLRQCAARMSNGDRSIVLTHYGAAMMSIIQYNNDPEGWLFDCIRSVVDAVAPVALVQGHVHDLLGRKFLYNGTLVVFPGPKGGILDVGDGQASFEFAEGQ